MLREDTTAARKQVDGATQTESVSVEADEEEEGSDPVEPVVRVRLLQTVWVPPCQCVLARATTDPKLSIGPIVPSERMEQEWGILAEVEPQEDGTIQVALTNPTGITQMVNSGETIGDVTGASMVCAENFEDLKSRSCLLGSTRNRSWTGRDVARKSQGKPLEN